VLCTYFVGKYLPPKEVRVPEGRHVREGAFVLPPKEAPQERDALHGKRYKVKLLKDLLYVQSIYINPSFRWGKK
jgi:hypothetical protein